MPFHHAAARPKKIDIADPPPVAPRLGDVAQPIKRNLRQFSQVLSRKRSLLPPSASSLDDHPTPTTLVVFRSAKATPRTQRPAWFPCRLFFVFAQFFAACASPVSLFVRGISRPALSDGQNAKRVLQEIAWLTGRTTRGHLSIACNPPMLPTLPAFCASQHPAAQEKLLRLIHRTRRLEDKKMMRVSC